MLTVHFTPAEVDLCHQLKSAGLPWDPAPGHFVWDGEGLIERPSPFHDRVYFILDLKHFLRRTGTTQRLVESMVWLPTWEQTRMLLSGRGVDPSSLIETLVTRGAIGSGTERYVLYEMLKASLH